MSHEGVKYFELNYVGLNKGRQIIKAFGAKNSLSYPSYNPVLDERWRALITKWHKLDAIKTFPAGSNLNMTEPELLLALIQACAEQNLMTEQREIYYVIRGKYPNLTIGGKLWKDQYTQFLGSYFNKVQMAVNMPMQSFGVEAGSRGSVAGEGYLILESGTRVPLDAEPKLRFELTRDGVRYSGHARKHIHYEKEAGFARLIGGDISKMIETVFSTSQGYSSEAASKFLRDSEERGLQTYCLHDGDPHGIQMQMMYGVASKNNCYMTDKFYPHNVKYLGLVPTVARAIGLPAEDVSETDRSIIPNLRVLLQEKNEFLTDVDIIDKFNEKWEYQALNAMNEKAPQVYLVEALMARNDEIKYVPVGIDLKRAISDSITNDVQGLVSEKINEYADRFYQENIKPKLVSQLQAKLESDITDFDGMMVNELPNLDAVTDTNIREAVKLKLVDNPRQFWDSAQSQVARDMLGQHFNITATVDWNVNVTEASAEKSLSITDPILPNHQLTKEDIVDSIQRRIITQKSARDKVVNPIRDALKQVFGKPDPRW